MLGCVEW